MKTIYRQRSKKLNSRNGFINYYCTGTATGFNLHVWQTRTSGNKINELREIVTVWLEHHGFIVEAQKGRKKC